MSKGPVEIATEMGLDFTHDKTQDGRYVRLFFKFPNPDKPKGVQPVALATDSFKIVAAKAEATPADKSFHEVVKQVTKFRKKMKPWTFDPQPPGEQGLIIAAELSFAGRFRVHAVNKKNRAALVKFWSPEAMARRAAIMQPTPQMGLFVLREQLEKYSIKKPDPETLRLQKALEAACQVVENDATIIPLRTDGNIDVREHFN